MHDACPSCGLRFSREQGYFTGAMYVSYGIAVPVLVVLTVVLGLIFPDWPISWNLAVCVILFLPFVPAVFRHSRILFIHFDRSVDP